MYSCANNSNIISFAWFVVRATRYSAALYFLRKENMLTREDKTTWGGDVTKAAKLLDERRPGWEREIAISNLEMISQTKCILGQLYGTCSDGEKALNISILDYVAFAGGKNAWIVEIARRRIQAPEKEEERELVTA